LDTEAAIAAHLRALRELPDVTGSVLASVDGLLIATDLHRIEPDTVAALASATVGVGRRFVEVMGLGAHHETVIQAESGCLASYAAGNRALLTVVAARAVNLARLHLVARPAALRIGAAVDAGDARPQAVAAPRPSALDTLPHRTIRPGRLTAAHP
jgi:uncharacterized protein